MTEAAILHR